MRRFARAGKALRLLKMRSGNIFRELTAASYTTAAVSTRAAAIKA